MKIAFSIYRRRSDNIKVMDIKDNFKCEMHSDKSMHPHAISGVIDMEVNSNRQTPGKDCFIEFSFFFFPRVLLYNQQEG